MCIVCTIFVINKRFSHSLLENRLLTSIFMEFQHWLWIDVETTIIKIINCNINYENRCWNPLYNIGFFQNWCCKVNNNIGSKKIDVQLCILKHFLHRFWKNQCVLWNAFYIDSGKTDIESVFTTLVDIDFCQNQCRRCLYNIDFGQN